MMEDSLKSHRPGDKGRQAIIDELMGRKQSFDSQRWKPSQEWAQKWHDERMEGVRANAAQYGLAADESLPRMLPEYQSHDTFRDDFMDVPRRWGIPSGVELVLLRDLCREMKVSPVALLRWENDGLPVLRYQPWFAYDRAKVLAWTSSRDVQPNERMSDEDLRRPLLHTLQALAQGQASLAEARQLFQGFMATAIRAAGHRHHPSQVDPYALDPVWAEEWEARHPQELVDNAREYGLSEPTGYEYGIPRERQSTMVFEIRDLCRRLQISPFDVVRWTTQGMPCLRRSPWMRWDAERVAAWVAEHEALPARQVAPGELDLLEDFVLAEVAQGTGTAEEAGLMLEGWLGLAYWSLNR